MQSAPPAPFSLFRRFDDGDEMAQFLGGWELEFTQMGAGPFEGTHLLAGYGPVLLQEGYIGPALLQRGGVPPHPTFAVLVRPEARMIARGREVDAEHIFVVRPGEELQLRSGAGFHVFTLSVGDATLREMGRELFAERAVERALGARLLRPTTAVMQSLRHALRRAANGFRQEVALAAGLALADGAIRALVRALMSASEDDSSEEASLDRVALQLDAALSERPQHPFAIGELTAQVGASERTLRRAAHAWFGVPPLTLAKHRRLNGARRELLASDASRGRVTQVAMQWGFSHLGRFAGEYRDLFGESPSVTLQKRKSTEPRKYFATP